MPGLAAVALEISLARVLTAVALSSVMVGFTGKSVIDLASVISVTTLAQNLYS